MRTKLHNQDGFTVIEVLAVSLIAITLLGLGAQAAQHYWRLRALQGARSETITELRQIQQRSESESHPVVYGARFRPGSGPGGSSEIGVVRYDYAAGTCTQISTKSLSAGVYVSGASFVATPPAPRDACRSQIPGAASDPFVFLFARGTAYAGSVTFQHLALEQTKTVTVTALTGRVE